MWCTYVRSNVIKTIGTSKFKLERVCTLGLYLAWILLMRYVLNEAAKKKQLVSNVVHTSNALYATATLQSRQISNFEGFESANEQGFVKFRWKDQIKSSQV